jgi:hypothetical protein
MRKEKAVISLFERLMRAVSEEADSNPAFCEKLEAILIEVAEAKPRAAKIKEKPAAVEDLPDIHGEWSARGEAGFRVWLAAQKLPVLRGIISREDLDSTRKTARWRTAEKLAVFIADSLAARRGRGGGFLSS